MSDTEHKAPRPEEVDDALSELRRLLVGPEREQITEVRERLDNPEVRAGDVSVVLAEAVRLRDSDPMLTEAMAPMVERSLSRAVEKDPGPVIRAISPVMGKAIRRAITDALEGMLQRLNQTMEHSLTPRGIKWRIESMRTGRPLTEVVMLNTLEYRVEQVFYIHKETGLLLHHAVAAGVETEDSDMVSGMLTAITSFVQDSFAAEEDEGVNTLAVGELKLWIESDEDAVIASVIRGTAPLDYRKRMLDVLGELAARFGPRLTDFDGDVGPFELARPDLVSLLESRRSEQAESKGMGMALMAVGVGILLLGLLVGLALHWAHQRTRFVEEIDAMPGVVVIDWDREWRGVRIRGLKDPLAGDPVQAAPEFGLKPEWVRAHWDSYWSVETVMALRRANSILRPPDGVTVELVNGVVSLSGTASEAWLAEARIKAAALPGVPVDLSAVQAEAPAEPPELKPLLARVNAARILLRSGRAPQAAPDSAADLEQLRRDLDRLQVLADQLARRYRVTVYGHSDPSGAPAYNRELEGRRAQWGVKALGATRSRVLIDGRSAKESGAVTSLEQRALSFRAEELPE